MIPMHRPCLWTLLLAGTMPPAGAQCVVDELGAAQSSVGFGSDVHYEGGQLFVADRRGVGETAVVHVFERQASNWVATDGIEFPTEGATDLDVDGDLLVLFSRVEREAWISQRSAGSWSTPELAPSSANSFGEGTVQAENGQVFVSLGGVVDVLSNANGWAIQQTLTPFTGPPVVAVSGDRLVTSGTPSLPQYRLQGGSWSGTVSIPTSFPIAPDALVMNSNYLVAAESLSAPFTGPAQIEIYELVGNTWQSSALVTKSFVTDFGFALALDGDRLALTWKGVQTVDYEHLGGAWLERGTFFAPDPTLDFGQSIALGAGYQFVGAPAIDPSDEGRVYAALLAPGTTPYCTAKINSDGCAPTIDSLGTPSASSVGAFEVSASLVVAQKSGLLFYGLDSFVAPFFGGTLCASPPLQRTPIQNSGGFTIFPCDGAFSFDFQSWIASGTDPQLVAGASVYAQYWYRDPSQPTPVGLTDALAFTLCP